MKYRVMGLLALALWRAWYELTRLVARLPVLLSGLPALADELEGWAYRFLVALPLPLQDAAREGLECILPALGHGLEVLRGTAGDCAR